MFEVFQHPQFDSDLLPKPTRQYPSQHEPGSNVVDLMKIVEERTKKEVEDQY